jgi:Bromodomain
MYSFQKHLKRKEYLSVAQFAQDVELVFSNAMQFNEDHTPLWEAARQLKVSCFRSLGWLFLMTSTGVLCEIDVRPPSSLCGAAIYPQRFTTPI